MCGRRFRDERVFLTHARGNGYIVQTAEVTSPHVARTPVCWMRKGSFTPEGCRCSEPTVHGDADFDRCVDAANEGHHYLDAADQNHQETRDELEGWQVPREAREL